MKLQIEEAELRNLAHKASRYDIIMDALIREKFDKIDIYSDWEMTENYMQNIINQQPSDIKSADDLKKEDIYKHITSNDNTIEFMDC